MPNTLNHLGLQSSSLTPWLRAGERSLGRFDLLMVVLGAALPDAVWILQRVLRKTALLVRHTPGPEGDPFFLDLRLYGTVQSSLLFCLVLALAVSVVAARPKRAFGILAASAVVHLLLDSLEIKWANGVVLLAPFDWQPRRMDLVWPESAIVTWLTFFSLLILPVLAISLHRSAPTHVLTRDPRRWAIGLLVLCTWTLAPITLLPRVRSANANFIGTLTSTDRDGKYLELGVASVTESEPSVTSGVDEFEAPRQTLQARTPGEEVLLLSGATRGLTAGRYSLRGTLRASPSAGRSDNGSSDEPGLTQLTTFEVTESHRHQRGVRDAASLAGLVFIAVVWGWSFLSPLRHRGERNRSLSE